MALPLLTLVWAMQFPVTDALVPAATASPRPRVCASRGWARASAPARRRACSLLARGYSLLGSDSARALALSKQVQALGLDSQGRVLEARCHLRQGDPVSAHARFQELVAGPDAGLLTATDVLREQAAAAQLSGDPSAPLLYRRLVPRLSYLRDVARAGAFLEAALALAEAGSQSWPEARRYLGQAMIQDDRRGVRDVALAALALIGEPLSELEFDRVSVQRMLGKSNRLWVSRSSRLALLAISQLCEDPELGTRSWQSYRRSSKNPVFVWPLKAQEAVQ